MHRFVVECAVVSGAFIAGVAVSQMVKVFAAKQVGKAEQIGQKEFDKLKGKL